MIKSLIVLLIGFGIGFAFGSYQVAKEKQREE